MSLERARWLLHVPCPALWPPLLLRVGPAPLGVASESQSTAFTPNAFILCSSVAATSYESNDPVTEKHRSTTGVRSVLPGRFAAPCEGRARAKAWPVSLDIAEASALGPAGASTTWDCLISLHIFPIAKGAAGVLFWLRVKKIDKRSRAMWGNCTSQRTIPSEHHCSIRKPTRELPSLVTIDSAQPGCIEPAIGEKLARTSFDVSRRSVLGFVTQPTAVGLLGSAAPKSHLSGQARLRPRLSPPHSLQHGRTSQGRQVDRQHAWRES